MTELINNIMETTDRKIIVNVCKKILKKCSFKSSNDLGNVENLAYWLYVSGNLDKAAAVCDILKDQPFTGDYNLWDCTDCTLCLKARIFREQGRGEEGEEIIGLVNEYRHPELYINTVDWFTDTLDKNIESNLKSGSKAGARKWRMMKLKCAVKYREAGGYPLPDEELEEIIRAMTEILSSEK